MKKLCILIVIICCAQYVYGQQHLPKIDDYRRFLKSKTMVVYDDEMMSDFNMKIKEIMKRSWSITPVEFITSKEFEKVKHNPDLSFLLTSIVTFDKDKIKARYNFLCLLMGQPNAKITNLPDLCSLPLSYAQVEDESYYYKLEAFVQFLQSHVNAVLVDPTLIGENGFKKYSEGAGRLADKTLYLIKEEVAPDIRDLNKIKAIYPHKVKFVTQEDVEEAVAQKDNNIVFLHKVGPEGTRTRARVYKLIVGAGDSKLYYWDYQMIEKASDDALQAKDLKKMK